MGNGNSMIAQRDAISSDGKAVSLSALQIALLVSLVLALAVAGGTSRFDLVQIAFLRPFVVLLLIPTLYFLVPDQLRRAPALGLLLALWLVWMIVQLIPLPVGIWQSLPGRDVIAELDAAAGLEGVSRPISFTPFRGMGAVFSMLVPICAFLLAIAFKLGTRQLLFLIVALALFDAGLGLLQVIGGAQSPLYVYAITSRGFPVGIFANENHSAVFSGLALLVIARLALSSRSAADPRWIQLAYVPGFVFILLALLVSGSRAGLSLGLAALLMCCVMMWLKHRMSNEEAVGVQEADPRARSGVALASIGLGLLAGLIGVFLAFERVPAFEALLARDSFADLRWSLWPVLTDMMQTHWVLGTGFGSFDKVYQMYEPTDLLLRAYVNQAHNDWAQVVIEGGLPAVGILVVLLGWVATAIFHIWSNGSGRYVDTVFWLGVIAIVCAASFVDYPLRTPIFQSSFIWLLIVLADDKRRSRPHP